MRRLSGLEMLLLLLLGGSASSHGPLSVMRLVASMTPCRLEFMVDYIVMDAPRVRGVPRGTRS